MRATSCLWLLATLLFGELVTQAAPLDRWHWVAPMPQGNNLRKAAFLYDRFVVVGEKGTVMHSTDTMDWTVAASPSDVTLLSVAYGNGKYVIGGEHGFIWVSDDLTNWTQASTPVFTAIRSITFGNGVFMAVTDGGEAIKSGDGNNWTKVLGPMLVDFRAVHYAQGHFWIAGGYREFTIYEVAEGVLLKSTDGDSWQPEVIGGRSIFTQVTQAGEELLVLELAGGLHIRSAAGAWRHHSVPGYPLTDLMFGGGKYIAHNIYGSGISYVGLSSTNGYLWTFMTGIDFYHVNSSAYGNGYFLLAGNGGQLFRSTDGETFEPAITNFFPPGIYGPMAYGADRLLLAGYRYAELDYESVVFAQQRSQSEFTMAAPEGLNGLQRIEWAYGKFIATAVGQLAISNDGIEWAITPVPVSEGSDMLIVNEKILLITSSTPSTIAILSLAGEMLSNNSYPDYGSLSEIEYGMGWYWMIGGNGNKLYKSADAITWQLVTAELPLLGKFSAQGGRLLILGNGGLSITSTDGLTWQYGATGSGMTYPQSLRFIQNKYVALLNPAYSSTPIWKSQVVSSDDGLHWQLHYSFGFRGSDLVYGNGRYYVSGQAGGNNVIMESDFSVSLQLTRQEYPNVTIDGPVERYYRVERATVLGPSADWTEIDEVFAPQMPFTYQDTSATEAGPYFYRMMLGPERKTE